ncbi:MAG: SpoVR family protein [Chloroflexi bacterium]|nr:SpoVR family protein [Chloroflexota bacterium]
MEPNVVELETATGMIWDIARRLGLDPFPTHFEIVPAAIMYEFGAYGLPGRFSHWTHGKAYHQMKTMYDYGLSKIYELVINANPCYAFLMDSNTVLQNKLVIAHVLAHSDFFKNSVYFSHTSRQMVEGASVNADRIRKYEFLHGQAEVEQFLDAVLSIQEHIDPNVFIRNRSAPHEPARPRRPAETPFDDLFPRRPAPAAPEAAKRRLPEEPQKDLLAFVMEHAPDLEDWQRDIIAIVRSEMLYFLPQMQTKLANEGWAAFFHARILRDLDLSDDEYVEFASLNASVLSPSRRSINPYFVGLKIFEDIYRRWESPTAEERARTGRTGGEGLAKIFEVREIENDVSLLRNYLTRELVDDLDLYLYRLEGNDWVIVEKNWEKVRDNLVHTMTNFGYPYIVVEDADYHRARELLLHHLHEGLDLDVGYAEKTLRYVYRLWGRPVHLETIRDGDRVVLSYDGSRNTTAKR